MKKLFILILLTIGLNAQEKPFVFNVNNAIDHSSTMSCVYTGEQEYQKDMKSFVRTVYVISKGTCSVNKKITCEITSKTKDTNKIFEGKGICR